MSIQSSLNQSISTFGVMAGLYAQTPTGKAKSEIRKIKADEPLINQQVEQASSQVSPTSSPAVDRAYTEAYKKQVAQSKRLWELDPTKENFKEYTEGEEALEEWEAALKYTQDQRQATLKNQKEVLEMRKQLLEGTPEFTYRKTKVEVNNNGN